MDWERILTFGPSRLAVAVNVIRKAHELRQHRDRWRAQQTAIELARIFRSMFRK